MSDLPEFMNERTSRARKQYQCCECGGKIVPGMMYKAITGKWDGEVATYRLHIICHEIAEAARTFFRTEADLFDDELPGIGELVERARDDADEGDYFPPYWPSGVWISQGALRDHVAKLIGVEPKRLEKEGADR